MTLKEKVDDKPSIYNIEIIQFLCLYINGFYFIAQMRKNIFMNVVEDQMI